MPPKKKTRINAKSASGNRADMRIRCKSLGISYNGNDTSAKLITRINAASATVVCGGESASPTSGDAAVVASVAAAGVWGLCPILVPFPVMPSGPGAVSVHMKSALEVFVSETAAGMKFWECSVQSGMFKRVCAGDLMILTQNGTKGMVIVVGEIANSAIRRETRRDVLYDRISPHVRAPLDKYLGEAEKFDYIQFTQVFDMTKHKMSYRDVLAQGRFEDPCLPWLGLLTTKKTPASSIVALRDFLATHGVRRICQDGADID